MSKSFNPCEVWRSQPRTQTINRPTTGSQVKGQLTVTSGVRREKVTLRHQLTLSQYISFLMLKWKIYLSYSQDGKYVRSNNIIVLYISVLFYCSRRIEDLWFDTRVTWSWHFNIDGVLVKLLKAEVTLEHEVQLLNSLDFHLRSEEKYIYWKKFTKIGVRGFVLN